MSFSHKAYVFDYDAFAAELLPIVARALEAANGNALAAFIDEQRTALVDPDSHEALDANWRRKLPGQDVDAYADLALTKYYDPSDDIGFGNDWQEVSDAIARLDLPATLLLGAALQRGGVFLDPGKMGTYFQSAADVRSNLQQLDAAVAQTRGSSAIDAARRMLESAALLERGLFVTF
jgi:hypothetical protein